MLSFHICKTNLGKQWTLFSHWGEAAIAVPHKSSQGISYDNWIVRQDWRKSLGFFCPSTAICATLHRPHKKGDARPPHQHQGINQSCQIQNHSLRSYSTELAGGVGVGGGGSTQLEVVSSNTSRCASGKGLVFLGKSNALLKINHIFPLHP